MAGISFGVLEIEVDHLHVACALADPARGMVFGILEIHAFEGL